MSKSIIAPIERVKYMYIVRLIIYSDKKQNIYIQKFHLRLQVHSQKAWSHQFVERQHHEHPQNISSRGHCTSSLILGFRRIRLPQNPLLQRQWIHLTKDQTLLMWSHRWNLYIDCNNTNLIRQSQASNGIGEFYVP